VECRHEPHRKDVYCTCSDKGQSDPHDGITIFTYLWHILSPHSIMAEASTSKEIIMEDQEIRDTGAAVLSVGVPTTTEKNSQNYR
jgi:hypothetical protein